MNHQDCYVYVYLNPLKPGRYCYEGIDVAFLYEPFYVGKGTGYRMYQHIKCSTVGTPKYNVIKEIENNGYDPRDFVIQAAKDLPEMAALEVESILISRIGRKSKDKGPLLNILAGGGGRASSRSESNKYHPDNIGTDALLSEEEIEEAIEMYLKGHPLNLLACNLKVSTSYLNKIIVRRKVPRTYCRGNFEERLVVNFCSRYINGESLPALMEELSVGLETAFKMLKQYDLRFSPDPSNCGTAKLTNSIAEALMENKLNISKVAKSLNITRQTMHTFVLAHNLPHKKKNQKSTC